MRSSEWVSLVRLLVAIVVLALAFEAGPTPPAAAQSPQVPGVPAGAWKSLGPDGNFSVTQVAVSPQWPADPFILATGYDDQSERVQVNGTERIVPDLLRSADGGKKWDRFTLPSGGVGSLVIGPVSQAGRVILGVSSEPAGEDRQQWFTMWSSDGGEIWARGLDLTGTSARVRFSPAFAQDGQVFVLDGWRLYRSRDFGSTWAAVSPVAGQRVQHLEFSPELATDGTIVAAVTTGQFFVPWDRYAEQRLPHHESSAGIVISLDGGDSWQPPSNGLAAPSGTGVYGKSTTGAGVYGESAAGYPTGAVSGVSLGAGPGVSVVASNTVARYAKSTANIGLYGNGDTGGGTGVYGHGTHGGNAAYFNGTVGVGGNVAITGSLTVSGSYPKSAAVPHPDGTLRRLYCMESPESWFEDFGSGQLSSGRAQVSLDREFALLVKTDGYQVFPIPEGDCKGLYITNKTSTGFEVRELQGGTSSIPFGYRIVARRKNIAAPRLEKVEVPKVTLPPGEVAGASNGLTAAAGTGVTPVPTATPTPTESTPTPVPATVAPSTSTPAPTATPTSLPVTTATPTALPTRTLTPGTPGSPTAN